MSVYIWAVAFSAFLAAPAQPSLALKEVETVLMAVTACDVCECVAGENPKDVVSCQGLADVKVVTLPTFVNSIRISGATGKVLFKRGSIRTNRQFKVEVTGVQTLQFEAKSLNLLSDEGSLDLQMSEVDEAHCLRQFLSAPAGGRAKVTATKVNNLHLNGKAFDVLDSARFDRVKTLHLSPFALKPNNLFALGLHFEASFRRTGIKTLPSDTFPSAASITFVDCDLANVESNAFSGNQVQVVNFTSTSIDRIHGQAFPEKLLVKNLVFDRCTLAGLSERAIVSGVTLFLIENSLISSISEQAVDSTVAEIVLANNTFNTLSRRAVIYKSWSNLTVSNNTFKFVEGGAFEGVSNSEDVGQQSTPPAFNFVGNRISNANMNALRLNLSAATVAKISANVYEKDCHCRLRDRLAQLTAGNATDFGAQVLDTSLCRVPKVEANCFDAETSFVLIGDYYSVLCGGAVSSDVTGGNDDVSGCKTSQLDHAWNVFQDKIEVNSNRGILLILLLFVLASCLVVGVVTLIRWIVFAIRNRNKYEATEEEWNFTKVEERLVVPSPVPLIGGDHALLQTSSSPTSGGSSSQERHYESLPLTTTEVMLESTPSSPSYNNKGGQKSSNEGTALKQLSRQLPAAAAADASIPDVIVQERPVSSCGSGGGGLELLESATAAANNDGDTVGQKPQPTFYDEMLCLLKEKLDDPDNYATVADMQNGAGAKKTTEETQHLLYQDPLDLSKDSNNSNA